MEYTPDELRTMRMGAISEATKDLDMRLNLALSEVNRLYSGIQEKTHRGIKLLLAECQELSEEIRELTEEPKE